VNRFRAHVGGSTVIGPVNGEDMAEHTFSSALAYIKVHPTTGAASLMGNRCSCCGTVLLGARRACPACCARESLEAFQLATAGSLQSYTIVHRSYPGVRTPFIAAIVELDGGGVLKGTLRNFPADPALLLKGLRVRVQFAPTEQHDRECRAFVCHYFEAEPSS
jgi:uncharacterized protein